MSSGRRLLAIVFLIGGFALIAIVVVILFSQAGGSNTASPAPEVIEPTLDPNATIDPNAPPSTPQPAGTSGPMIEVVVSLQTVPRGWQMTEAELTTDMRLAADVGTNVITNIDDAIGLYARTDIFQGETLTFNTLVGDPTLVGVEEYGPSSLIPEGFVAQAVPMDRLSSVAYGLAAGDSVDLMITFYVAEVDPEFQTLLQNSATFYLESVDPETGDVSRNIVVLDPFGRFETLPTGDLAFVAPSESQQRPTRVSIILQNARVVQVGPWSPAEALALPTETPTPDPEATATPEVGAVPTATPPPPDVLLIALATQQQLLLKYAVESLADIDFALRAPNDSQIYAVDNVDLAYILNRFGIEPPIDFEFTVDPVFVTVTPQVTVEPTVSPDES